MVFNDLVDVLSAATPDQIQALRELVAPETKLTRLQTESDDLANKINAGTAAAQTLLATYSTRVHSGDATAVPPSWDDLVAAFKGVVASTKRKTP